MGGLLRFISYYQAYIQNFSHRVLPLYSLLSTEKTEKKSEGKALQKTKKKKGGGDGMRFHPLTQLHGHGHQAVLCELIDLLSQPPVSGAVLY